MHHAVENFFLTSLQCLLNWIRTSHAKSKYMLYKLGTVNFPNCYYYIYGTAVSRTLGIITFKRGDLIKS